MTWQGSAGFCGVMDSGKSYAAAQWLSEAPAGGIYWDPQHDAKVPGAAEIGPHTSAALVRQALASGVPLVYRSAGARYYQDEAAWIILTMRRLGGLDRPVRRVVFDEGHLLMRTGRVHPLLAEEWYVQRHHSLEIGWASPLVEAIDYEIVRTTVFLRAFRQPWRPWMSNQGFSREMLRSLAMAPDYSSLFRDLRQANDPTFMAPGI